MLYLLLYDSIAKTENSTSTFFRRLMVYFSRKYANFPSGSHSSLTGLNDKVGFLSLNRGAAIGVEIPELFQRNFLEKRSYEGILADRRGRRREKGRH